MPSSSENPLMPRPPLYSLFKIVLLQELGPEILWRSGDVRPTLRGKVHEIPIRPHRVDVVHHRFGAPEMENLPVPLLEDMHYRPLHVVGISLALVVSLIGRLRSGHQRHLRPPALSGPRIDSFGRSFG